MNEVGHGHVCKSQKQQSIIKAIQTCAVSLRDSAFSSVSGRASAYTYHFELWPGDQLQNTAAELNTHLQALL